MGVGYRLMSFGDGVWQAVCSRMNSAFATSQHQDSQELLEYLMSGLSEGLNKVSVIQVKSSLLFQ